MHKERIEISAEELASDLLLRYHFFALIRIDDLNNGTKLEKLVSGAAPLCSCIALRQNANGIGGTRQSYFATACAGSQ